MSKIRIKATINNEKFLFKGIKKQNKLIYKDNDILVTIDIANVVTLRRENFDFKLNLIFDKNKNTNGIYLLKSANSYLDLLIETKKLIVLEDFIEIIYNINNNKENIEFKLEFEEI